MIYGEKKLVDNPTDLGFEVEEGSVVYTQQVARGFVEDERYFIKNGGKGFEEVVKYKEIDYNTFEKQGTVQTWLDENPTHFFIIPILLNLEVKALPNLPFSDAAIGQIIFERNTHYTFEEDESDE